MKSTLRLGVFAIVFLGAVSRPAIAEPLLAGDVLRLTFDLATGLSFAPGTVMDPGGRVWTLPEDADVFGVSVLVNGGSLVNTFTARVYDGDRLLGSSTIPAQPVLDSPFGEYANFYFVSPTSLLTGVDPLVIDFTSFVNGSIDGAVEFAIDSGQIDRPGPFQVVLFLGHAVGPREAYGRYVYPHGESPIPEPASLLLIGSGIAGLAVRARTRRRRDDPPTHK
ncbi:MAG TPA: PEP-CTERM sorting domain-containing protein [Vicinamibacterales bacterium]|nr:PEP-CTERM sorting domain-containing protein [Vicinamibacterales bacterium]